MSNLRNENLIPYGDGNQVLISQFKKYMSLTHFILIYIIILTNNHLRLFLF